MINYLDQYKGFDLYKPLYEDSYIATGLPTYFIVNDDKPKFVRGQEGPKCQKYIVKLKKVVKFDN